MGSWGGPRPNSGPKKGPDGRAIKAKAAKPATAKPETNGKAVDAKAEPRRPFFSDASVEAILRAIQERQLSARNRPRTPDWNPYVIRPERFGPVQAHVSKHKPQLAMDKVRGLARDNNIAIQAWQAGGLLGNLVSEGLLFLGYPYLSELAQRPEFRLFGEIRAQEMTRKWIEFRAVQDDSTKGAKGQRNKDDDERAKEKRQAGDEEPRDDGRNKEIEDKIKELNDAMDEFRVRDWFKVEAEQDSYFGISHLYLDIKGTDLNNQRDPELAKPIGDGRDKVSRNKLTRGCLRGMRAIEPIWVYPTTYNAQNPLLPSWYDPQVWYVMGAEIHKTRLLSFIGRPVPDILKPAYAFGGLSMTQMAQPYVDIWLRTRESVGEIIHAFSVMILQTNLGTTTQPGGADLLARLAMFNALRDNQGVYAIDKATEDFKNVSAPLSGLDELQSQAQEHMFSVGRIPAVKFAGIQPKGLNATSEGELRAFYDTIVGEQNHLFRPNLTTVADIVQTHLWGACDRDITYDFVPLMEQTDKEKAEIRKMDAETSQVLIDSGQISQEEGRRRLALDPESGYHEINPDDVPELLEEEEEGLVPPGAGRSLEGIVGEEGGEQPPQKGRGGGGNAPIPFGGNRRRAGASDAGFVESQHPRVKGGETAGQFAPAGGASGGESGAEKSDAEELEDDLAELEATIDDGDYEEAAEIAVASPTAWELFQKQAPEKAKKIAGFIPAAGHGEEGEPGAGPEFKGESFTEKIVGMIDELVKSGDPAAAEMAKAYPEAAAKIAANQPELAEKLGIAGSGGGEEEYQKKKAWLESSHAFQNKPAVAGANYRRALMKAIKETPSGYGDHEKALKAKLIESWQKTHANAVKKGKGELANSIAKKLTKLGVPTDLLSITKPSGPMSAAAYAKVEEHFAKQAEKAAETAKQEAKTATAAATKLNWPTPTEQELQKAKNSNPLKIAYLSDVTDTPETVKLIKEFNDKYAGKSLTTTAALTQKVDDYKTLVAKAQAIAKVALAKQKEQQAKAAAEAKAKAEAAAKEAAEKNKAVMKDLGITEQEATGFGALVSMYGKKSGDVVEMFKQHEQEAKAYGYPISGFQAALIKSYTGSGYMAVNSALRSGSWSEAQHVYVKLVNKALQAMPTYKGTVKRGASLATSDQAKYQVGHVVEERAFTSSSITKPWSGNTQYTITAIGKRGAHVRKLSSHPGENEVVFSARTFFRVTKVESSGGALHVHMEEMEE